MTSAEFTQKMTLAKQLKKEYGGYYLATQEWGADEITITATDDVSRLGDTCRWVATRSIAMMRKHMAQRDPYFCYRIA